MEKETCYISCVQKGEEKSSLIELEEKTDAVEINFYLDAMSIRKEGDNFFETLIELRKELEKMDIQMLCKGCSRNVYPSGMLLSMGAGRKAYTLTLGETAMMSSLVDIFAPCSLEEYGTIEQQKFFFESWISSLEK